MSGRYPDWNVEGADWPNREHSRFVEAGGYDWHIQQAAGKGKDRPQILLIHGTGGATHSWRALLPLLAEWADVLAMDLPGHGFTRASFARKVTLPGMAESLDALLDETGFSPDLVIGHSAGAAIGVQWLLDGERRTPLIGFAPALQPFPGLAARLFPALATMLFANPFVATIFSRMASGHGEVERFLSRATGSRIDREGIEFYRRLFSHSGHCDGALRMMANWDLETHDAQLPELRAPVLLVLAERDKAIPADSIERAAARMQACTVERWPGLGHLAHEEAPQRAADLIREFWENAAGGYAAP